MSLHKSTCIDAALQRRGGGGDGLRSLLWSWSWLNTRGECSRIPSSCGKGRGKGKGKGKGGACCTLPPPPHFSRKKSILGIIVFILLISLFKTQGIIWILFAIYEWFSGLCLFAVVVPTYCAFFLQAHVCTQIKRGPCRPSLLFPC